MAERHDELMEEAVKWLRVMGVQQAREVITEVLTHDDEEWQDAAKLAYQLSNGENSTKDIAQHISYSYRWVSYRQQEWASRGILTKDGSQEPYEHIISLDEIGIDYQDIQEGKS